MEKNINELQVHPFNDKLYNEFPDSLFIENIGKYGIIKPLAINSNNQILGGQRRFKAAEFLKIKTVPVIIIDVENEHEFIILDNIYRSEKKPSLMMREGKELNIIDKENAAKRKKEGQQKGADVTKGLGPKKTTSLSKKRATSITAKKVGLGSRTTYEKLENVFDEAEAGNQLAGKLMDDIDDKKISINKAKNVLDESKIVLTPEQKFEKEIKERVKKINSIANSLYKTLNFVQDLTDKVITLETAEEQKAASTIADHMAKAVRLGIQMGIDTDYIKDKFNVGKSDKILIK